MDLDDELRKLFSDDDRLDLHVSPEAEETVVRGAQRRRRRRGAAAGAFAVVALVGAGIGLVQLRHVPTPTDAAGPLLPTSSSAPSTPPPAPAPHVSTHTETVIVTVDPRVPNGNTNKGTPPKPPTGTSSARTPVPEVGGWGKLKLAMSEADALKTGVLVEPGAAASPDEKCKKYATQSVADADAVIISTVKGVVRITLPSYGKTTQGIGIGSKVADVKTAYPNAAENGSELVVPMNATPKWNYVFENDGTVVTKVRMRLADNDCAVA